VASYDPVDGSVIMEEGDRVRVIDIGPRDSFHEIKDGMIGHVGALASVPSFSGESYVACRVIFDEPVKLYDMPAKDVVFYQVELGPECEGGEVVAEIEVEKKLEEVSE